MISMKIQYDLSGRRICSIFEELCREISREDVLQKRKDKKKLFLKKIYTLWL